MKRIRLDMHSQAQSTIEILMRLVSRWVTENGFSLALKKTEIIILTKESFSTVLHFQVTEATVFPKPVVKFLGIMIDTNQTFSSRFVIRQKTAARMVTIFRLMSNV